MCKREELLVLEKRVKEKTESIYGNRERVKVSKSSE